MALITSFKKVTPSRIVRHSEAECKYFTFLGEDEKRYIQLETLGSKNRDVIGSQSQNIRLDEIAARELLKILKAEFERA